MERKNMWEHYTEEQERELEELAVRYRKCLDQSKTERECVTLSIAMAEENGYQNIEDCIREGVTLKAGDKVYAQYMKKTLALFHIGTKPLTEGMNILGAHVDSPRLDVKQNPLYEDTQMAYLDTHYYGGVKKYQWVTLPLAMHGVVVKKDGSVVDISIGEDEDDPVLYITDLLIHLAGKQLQKKAAEYEQKNKAGLTSPEEKNFQLKLQELLATWTPDSTLPPKEAFLSAKSGFDTQCEARINIIKKASSALENAFTFMEEAFGEGQEMVVFITELTMDPDTSQFITENGCERYFKYNKTLLVGNRRAAILKELDRDAIYSNPNEYEF